MGTEPLDLDATRETVEHALGFIRSGAPATDLARMPTMFLAVGAAQQLLAEVERLRSELVRYHQLHDRLTALLADPAEVMQADAVIRCIGTEHLPVQWPAVHAGEIRRALAKVNGAELDRPATTSPEVGR